ncbi:hypothetical protein RJ640_024374 [Escallonia rubra]|uniref:YbaK/aminoacyl-tRNA synthetase-associated domain-containing protein n=1 Tax=Escallonia rubra TaxID=112253 RepID=A0AA88UEJ3_9ASTE|nr:hypothetical protein RJ640_024374 [Escallonia rubra]
MGFTKEQLLARLKELQIEFAGIDHSVVLTVEDQKKYVDTTKGALCKNLFLKDKKHRLYLVSALADTKVDLKVLSQRLGLGKGGLRMAPNEALLEILQVPLGCVTPFALVNESARHVSLLLDQGFRSQDCCFFHPLMNDMSISLNSRGLDKFLKSIGKDPTYVDLEANPPVGKDQPPDLASLAPSEAYVLPDLPEKAASIQGHENNHVTLNNKSAAVTAKADIPSNVLKKEKTTNLDNLSSSFIDPEKFVEEILGKASAIVLSEINEENIKQHGEQLGSVVSNSILRHLSLELKNLATIYKNTAYTDGFHAGTRHQPKRQ